MAAIALMGTLASCQSDDDITVARPDNAVNMHLQVGSSVTTRSNAATTDADKQKQFNAGDQVSISATGQDAVIYQLQADGQTWRETEANKFLLWNASQLEFQAYYPVTTGTSMTAFTLPTDQSTEANINAADYMTVTETIARPTTGTDISLELERQTARVIVTISGFNDQYSDADKTVSNVRINSAAAAIANGAATGSVTAVTPYANGTGTQGTTYTALLIPATANASANFITLSDGEGSTLQVRGIPELEAGKSYTYSLTVGKNTIKVQSVTIVDWTTGETLAGGQAEEQTGPTTVLGGALVDGATIRVNFKWRMSDSGDYVQGVYSAASGTFTVSTGGDDWGRSVGYGVALYKVEKNGDNIIVGVGLYSWGSEDLVWTFDTTNDTYTYAPVGIPSNNPDWYGLTSVTLNGTNITSQLTAQ